MLAASVGLSKRNTQIPVRMDIRSVDPFRSYPLASVGFGFGLAAVLLLALAVWVPGGNDAAAGAHARSLVAQLVPDAQLTAEEYETWKQISNSEPETRLEVARLFQQNRYAGLLFESTELIGNTVIGLDQDAEMSRQLVEQLICGKLERDPRASDQAASLYMAPWLNPAGLDSAYCASVLTGSLLAGNPDTLAARARLLSTVLGRLPTATSRFHVAAIVNLMNSAAPADMAALFSALRDVDRAEFPDEFSRAVETLTRRISTAQSTADVPNLFDSIDHLKFEVNPAQLAIVIDAALNKVLVQDDVGAKLSIYVTLLDLKISHPEISFGARADYLMRGLHRYGDSVEIQDYSGVLRLNEQYGVDVRSEAALGSALLDAIREMGEPEYVSSILPYCKRFLEIAPELPYEILQRGAKLLVEQLHNEAFTFQRECLHDPALVERLESSDRSELAVIVLSALEAASQSGASGSTRRVANLMELLGLLEADPTSAQINQLKAAMVTAMESGPDARSLTDLTIAAVRGKFETTPDFYLDLLAMIAKAAPDSSVGLTFLLEALPDVQRSELIAAELQDFFALTDPADVASFVSVLSITSRWIAPEDQRRIGELLVAAIDETQDMSIVPKLSQPFSEPFALKQAILRKIAASTERSDLAHLFDATRTLRRSSADDANDRTVLRAAVARFLDQIVPPDGHDASVRGVIKRFDLRLSPDEVEQLAVRFIQALRDETNYGPIANYAGSIQVLSLQAMPGELDSLLAALHAKLISTTNTETYPLLLSTWLAVEASTKQYVSSEQRLPLYNELLRLPLMSRENRTLLQERIDEITVSPQETGRASNQ